MDAYAKVYVSMPQQFLEELDRTAHEEHLSRSALIREAVKLYMTFRENRALAGFLRMSTALRRSAAGLDEKDLEGRIDRAVARVRGGDGS